MYTWIRIKLYFIIYSMILQATAYALIEIPDEMISKNIELKITTAEEVRYSGLTD